MEQQFKAILGPWTILALNDGTIRLFGHTHRDQRHRPPSAEFEDGHRILTSPIQQIDPVNGFAVTETGSRYRLDSVTPQQEADLIDQARTVLGKSLIERPTC